MDVESIKSLLMRCFQTVELDVEDDSGRHKRHKQSQGKGGHFKVLIVSDDFVGLDLVARHRSIYEALDMKDQTKIHALAIFAWTVEEWRKKCQSK